MSVSEFARINMKKKLATATNAEQALLAVAICEARNAFPGWAAVPFGSRKAIVASALKKLEADTDELSSLFWLEQRVFKFVTGSNDLGFGTTSLPEFDLITFTRSANTVNPAADSPSGTLAPEEEESIIDPKRIASGVTTLLRSKLFGTIEAIPTIRKPGRHGLASTLFEILSFRPTRMKTQVLVWRLARKASYTFPMFRSKA